MRRWLSFDSGGHRLAGAIDDAGGDHGVLIVSGGNEILSGSHGGMASLAGKLLKSGISVMRYDRRGVGDSEGVNGGYATSRPDIKAALTAFRDQCPDLKRVVATGNCDGATALGLFGGNLDLNGFVLTNMWLRDEMDALPSAAAIRGRYVDKLKDPREWRRLLSGSVSITKLGSGLKKALFPPKPEPGMEERLAAGLSALGSKTTLLNASRDATAIALNDALKSGPLSNISQRLTVESYDSNSHSFAGEGDLDALYEAIVARLA